MSSLLLGSDALLARESGPWAEEKLSILDRYVNMVSTAMKGKFGGLVFVDLMAGPGLCLNTRGNGPAEFSGSTLRALRTKFSFSRIVAIESDPDCVAALRARLLKEPRGSLCELIEDDCNNPAVIKAVRAATQGCLTVMFVDLLGTEVRMSTLRAMTTDRKIDLLVTWPTMDAVRNAPQMLGQADRWTSFFGTDEWQS